MLVFSDNKQPDKIFTEILRGALKGAIDIVKYPEEDESGEYYKSVFPTASRNFPREKILYVLRELLEYSNDPNLWKMKGYHYVLLYDALRHYCEVSNEDAIETEEPMFSVDDYKIMEINFEDLLSHYFKDLDFLLRGDVLLDLPEEIKKQFGFDTEMFGVVTGMEPHAEELTLEFYKQGEFFPEDPEPKMFSKGSGIYPNVSEI